MRIVDYHLQTVKIDLNYTLLYINKEFYSYLCFRIVSAAHVVVTSGWHNKDVVQELIGK